ncbi:hypothetical protein INR49_023991 [Caranx melampygus]|nr:hypothetical protein INR49_023991 [Caranx melampygus]
MSEEKKSGSLGFFSSYDDLSDSSDDSDEEEDSRKKKKQVTEAPGSGAGSSSTGPNERPVEVLYRGPTICSAPCPSPRFSTTR